MRNDVDDWFARQEALWRDRALPEIEWDESEASLALEEVLGEPPARRFVPA